MAGKMEEALRRIYENKRTKSKILDLSGLGLTELPEELWDCVWVEELGLGNYWSWNVEKENWVSESDDTKIANRFSSLPNTISKIKHLTKLYLDHNPISDVSVLSSLVNLTTLDLSSTSISDVSVLSSLVNLTTLDLSYTSIIDISVLSSLVNLTNLYLIFTSISDVSVLSSLVNLTNLSLSCTSISDVSVLGSLVNLRNLDLSSTSISDVSVLSSMVNLTTLSLMDTSISDVSVLSSLVNLTNLGLGSTSINDVSVLSSLVNLTNLSLSSTSISDLSVLSSLVNLTNLSLSSTSISDISVLSSLVNLTNLSLSSTSISDLSVLSSLVNLTNLSLMDTSISDLSVLSSLVNLRNLDLSSTSISDVSVLSSLVNLRNLSLMDTSISDVSVLGSLVNLRNLYLSSTSISDLSVLSILVNLRNLDLSSTSISDISVLSSLVNLTNLDLMDTSISDVSVLSSLLNLRNLKLRSTSISDVSVLSSLVNLTNLNLSSTSISDISVLSSLVNLTNLDLSSMSISDISVLSSLVNLTNLYLIDTSISDISVLSSLVNLIELHLSESDLSYFPFELLSSPRIKTINLRNTHCLNIPPELTHTYNALPDLRNYYADLQKNAYTAYDAKVITVGNGRVGKTSVLKALFQLDTFNPQEDSTHGIQLFETALTLPLKQEQAKLRLWDFGGQELYHATHRIFMKSRALYILVWDSFTEQHLGEDLVTIEGETFIFRNFPLSYWLGNIRALSKDAKIIVVCNKMDNGQEHFPEQLHALQSQYHIDSFISVSAKTGYGISTLYSRVQHLLEQMPEMGMQMPLSWKNVQDKLAAIQDKPYIDFAAYRSIGEEEELSEGSMHTLLRFLHHSGFLFWHEEYLKDHIILDQKWALDAIYQLLDRNSWYEVLKGNALRKRSVLAKCWSDYTFEQVKLFLEIMQSCELVLIIDDKNQQEDPIYLIPEFLPDHPATAVAYGWEAAASTVYHFRFQHHFFHAALIQRFIVRSAKLAESYDLLWRTGILLQVKGTLARIQVYPEAGSIDIQLRGSNPSELIERLKNEITAIQEIDGEAGFLLSLTGHFDEWVTLEQLKLQISKGKSQIASTTGEILELAPFRPLLSPTHLERERDQDAPGLKELSAQVSGSQLLEPTEPRTPIEGFQNQVKVKLIDADLPGALALLHNHLIPGTSSADELILLHSQYAHYEQESQRGLLHSEEKQLRFNRLVNAILSFLNSMQD